MCADRSTPLGQVINSYLTSTATAITTTDSIPSASTSTSPSRPPLEDHAIHLLFSANRWEALPQLLSALGAGQTLILDRYIYSGIAFSVAKGLDYTYCRMPDVGLPKPDAVIFLDLPPELAEGREGFGGERYEKRELQEKVRKVFDDVRRREGGEWSVIDATRGIDAVAEEVGSIADAAVKWAQLNELGRIE